MVSFSPFLEFLFSGIPKIPGNNANPRNSGFSYSENPDFVELMSHFVGITVIVIRATSKSLLEDAVIETSVERGP